MTSFFVYNTICCFTRYPSTKSIKKRIYLVRQSVSHSRKVSQMLIITYSLSFFFLTTKKICNISYFVQLFIHDFLFLPRYLCFLSSLIFLVFFRLSVYPFVYLSICLSYFPSVRLSVRLSIRPYVCLASHLSICLSIYLSVNYYVRHSIRPFLHPSFCSSG